LFIKNLVTDKFYFRHFFNQIVKIGFNSLPVVGLTAIFTGMVLALQSYTGFSRFSAESAIPNVVVLSITRELAPVLAGLMVAGRAGAAIAAEIGTMKVTEQIDALKTLSTNPFSYLVTPRVVAGIISLPFLVLIGDIIGVLGGYLICVNLLNFNPSVYLQNTYNFVEFIDIFSGLVKAAVFGFIITFIGCYFGFNTKGGAQGVGQSTTYSVVSSSILILLMNYIITSLFFKL
jgi:phospholipid/cholesterol/gamma-HCH transport system permease protein